ncbi:MAG: hypothetical protein OJJ54_06200 [Pseudonocardia sp.]|nr:hypothetical protein [Pseudonocardia sp.]
MKTSKWAGAGAAAVGAATTAAVLLMGTAVASADEGDARASSAFGIKASTPLVSIAPVPYARYAGKPVSDELIGTDGSLAGAPFAVRLVTAEADEHSAESSVADLDVAGLLKAKLIRTYCEDGNGGLQIVDGSVLGIALPETPAPKVVVSVSPLLTLTLNQKDEHSDGTTTYTGLALDLVTAGVDPKAALDGATQGALPGLADVLDRPGLLGAKTVGDLTKALPLVGGAPLLSLTVGSATCGPAAEETPEETPEETTDEHPPAAVPVSAEIPEVSTAHPQAPSPTVTEFSLPVTG